MTKLTLQINSLEALERLIGGDTEIEMELRQGVAAAFSKKHLAEIAKSPEYTRMANVLLGEQKLLVAEEIQKQNTDWEGYGGVNLTDRTKDTIQKLVAVTVANLIDDAVIKAVAAMNIDAKIEERITNGIPALVDNHVKREVEFRVAKKLEALKSAL